MELTLVRHTSLQVAEGVCYGQSDVDVSANFYQELAVVQQKLQAEHFSSVYSSPLQRCHKLALSLSEGLGHRHAVREDARLKELNFGDWEMQAWEDLPRAEFDIWAQNYAQLAPPNGETFSQLQQRGVAFLQEMQAKHAGEHLLVITHGGMIRALIAHALNMPLKGLFRFQIDYASVTRMAFSGAVPRISFVNR